MKKAIIVHGWGGSSKEPMLKWIKKELEKREYSVILEDMPNAESPDVTKWMTELNKIIKPGVDLIIGHSIGCLAIMKFLENKSFSGNEKIKKCIFIAPWIELDKKSIEEEGAESVEIVHKWTEKQVNWRNIKNNCNEIVCIFSDNDPYVLLANKDIFRVELNAKAIVLKNRYHFDFGNNINNLPEILQFI
ncbi:MAG: alpha/beta hydrolase [Patescibacteria group bacterium]